MNPKQKLFADEYLANGKNGMQAYLKVYKVKNQNTAKVNASKLLTNTNIKAYIDEHSQKHTENCGITFESQLERLNLIYTIAMTPSGENGRVDMRSAIAALQEQNRMIGFAAPTKAEVKTDLTLSDLKKVLSNADSEI